MVPFTPAWLRGEPAATSLLSDGFRRAADRSAAAGRAARRPVDPAVLEALIATTPAQVVARDALARPGTTAVVTGQQAGLFGGPLYTIHKAAAAIVDARALAAETGRPCVPVFWLQNEDHDLEEIATTRVLGSDGGLHAVAFEVPDARPVSVGARRLGPSVDAAFDRVEALLAGLSEAPATTALLRRFYLPDRSPDRAFRDLLDALFADHGLLVVDPRHPALVAAARPVHDRALADAAAIAAALEARADALRAAGFTVQVHVRPGAPLSFVHPDGPDGPRYRADPLPDGSFRVGDRAMGADAVARAARSTSALLRPILQDTLLPTAAYVGGPGEVAYFAQLPPLYAAFDLPMPLIVPRASFRVVDEAASRLMEQLGLGPEALGRPRDALLAGLARPHGGPDPDALEAALLEPMRSTLAGFAPHAAALDPGLAKATEKSAANLEETARRLVDRYRRALAQADTVSVERLDRLLARLQPDGAPQERVHGWPWFLARYGADRFVTAVLAAVVPFDGTLRELRP